MQGPLTDEDLEAGVAAGIITRQQLDALRAHASARAPHPEADEERFRVLGGFNDILVAIGLALLIGGFFTASSATGNAFVITIAAIALSWGLAEVFTARLKLALPSIMLSAMFVASVAIIAGATDPVELMGDAYGAIICLAGSGAALLHFWRFRVPIDIAIAAAGVCGAVIAVLTALPQGEGLFPFITLGCGLAVFALAMSFDIRDPARRTRLSDIGFWLHLLAAPLIVHSIISGLVGGREGAEAAAPAITLGLFAVFAVIALVVDRRALLVSGLGYAGYSLATLFERAGAETSILTTITLLVMALIVLGVSAGWRSLRAAIVPILPLGGLVERLPSATRR